MQHLKPSIVILGSTATILGLILSAFFLLLEHTWIYANGVFMVTHGAYLLAIPLLVYHAYHFGLSPNFSSPNVRRVLPDNILLIDPCEWMGHQTLVAIYKFEDEVERLFAAGEVYNIQSNKFIQIKILNYVGDAPTEEQITDMKKTLKIKPGVVK